MKKKSVSKRDIVNFLRQISKQISGEIIIYCDGLPQHKSALVKNYLEKHKRITIKRFPAYSPDMNPDECVWSYVKTRMIPNLGITNVLDLPKKVKSAFHKLQKRKDLIVSFLLQAELPWDEQSKSMLYNLYKAQ